MKPYKNKLDNLSVDELHILKSDLEHIAASSAHECDHVYNRIHCITVELIDRAVSKIPNAEKYAYNWKTGTVEVFFDGIHSKKYDTRQLTKGLNQ